MDIIDEHAEEPERSCRGALVAAALLAAPAVPAAVGGSGRGDPKDRCRAGIQDAGRSRSSSGSRLRRKRMEQAAREYG